MKHIRMPKALWEKWDAALRSGAYKQGTEHLHNPIEGSYCCLGVLQKCISGEIVRDGTDEVPPRDWLAQYNIEFIDLDGYASAQAPFIGEHHTCITSINDKLCWDGNDYSPSKHVWSFTNIADMIKDEVEFTDA